MKFNKSFALTVLGCLLGWIAIAQAQQDQHLAPSEPNDSNQNQGSTPAGLLSLILYPFHSTMTRAARFLGIDNVREQINLVELKAYKVFMSLYNKTYSPEEIPRRMALFFRRKKDIEESEKMYREGKSTFAMSENAFIDWDDNELKKLTGVSLPNKEELNSEERINLVGNYRMNGMFNKTVKAEMLPTSKDWRTSGCIAKPIEQADCGSCYAVSTAEVLESMHCIKNNWKTVYKRSPQQIVDCSTRYGNSGCDGGWPTRVLKYLQDVGELASDYNYPYVSRQRTCKFNQLKKQGRTFTASPTYKTKLEYKLLRNERDILQHVANTGPVVTVIEATSNFLYYGKGIFDDRRCRKGEVDHAIAIVGYGRENGVDYWLIKNSWGTDWGEGGYGKVKRGSFACSIGSWAWVITA